MSHGVVSSGIAGTNTATSMLGGTTSASMKSTTKTMQHHHHHLTPQPNSTSATSSHQQNNSGTASTAVSRSYTMTSSGSAKQRRQSEGYNHPKMTSLVCYVIVNDVISRFFVRENETSVVIKRVEPKVIKYHLQK